jgi:hypothetical protein
MLPELTLERRRLSNSSSGSVIGAKNYQICPQLTLIRPRGVAVLTNNFLKALDPANCGLCETLSLLLSAIELVLNGLEPAGDGILETFPLLF